VRVFEFFVTLSTAVVAGLVALATSAEAFTRSLVRPTATAAVAALLLTGLLTHIRMLHRNRITDEYQRTLKFIRDTWRKGH